jgi:hypothetical protein
MPETLLLIIAMGVMYLLGRWIGRQQMPNNLPPLNFTIVIDGDPIGGFGISDVEVMLAKYVETDSAPNDPPGRED